MSISVGVGGAWKEAEGFVGVGGAWKALASASVGVSSAWKDVDISALPGTVDLTFMESQTYQDSGTLGVDPDPAAILLAFQTNGSVSAATVVQPSPGVVGNWLASGANDNSWEIRFTLQAGDTPTGTFDTWMDLGSPRTLELGGVGTYTAVVTAEIRYDGGDVLTSGTFTLTSVFEP